MEVEDAASSEETTTVEESAEEDGISYEKATKYWDGIAPSVDGMLGGFGKISPIDVDGSSKFLKGLFKLDPAPGNSLALDCGAGIGRVTKHLLSRHFVRVDLVEQSSRFLEKAKVYLTGTKQVGTMFCSGLQDFNPSPGAYDVIWCQWVLGHLTEEHLKAFFRRCAAALRPGNGVLVVKENVTSSGETEQDPEDGSVTRPDPELRRIFEESDLELVRALQQRKFPQELYPVWMYALRPVGGSS